MKKRFFTLLLASALIVSVTACTTTIDGSNTRTSTNESSTTITDNSISSDIVESDSKNEETTTTTDTTTPKPETTTTPAPIPKENAFDHYDMINNMNTPSENGILYYNADNCIYKYDFNSPASGAKKIYSKSTIKNVLFILDDYIYFTSFDDYLARCDLNGKNAVSIIPESAHVDSAVFVLSNDNQIYGTMQIRTSDAYIDDNGNVQKETKYTTELVKIIPETCERRVIESMDDNYGYYISGAYDNKIYMSKYIRNTPDETRADSFVEYDLTTGKESLKFTPYKKYNSDWGIVQGMEMSVEYYPCIYINELCFIYKYYKDKENSQNAISIIYGDNTTEEIMTVKDAGLGIRVTQPDIYLIDEKFYAVIKENVFEFENGKGVHAGELLSGDGYNYWHTYGLVRNPKNGEIYCVLRTPPEPTAIKQ